MKRYRYHEYGVQPLTQYSTVGATTFLGKIMSFMIVFYRNLIYVSVTSLLVTVYLEAYHNINQILVLVYWQH